MHRWDFMILQVPVQSIWSVVRQPAMDTGMYKVVILAKLSRYDKLRKAMNAVGVTGMTVTQVISEMARYSYTV